MYKILVGLMVAVLVIGALIAVVGAAIGLFTNNFDMIGGAIFMLLMLLFFGVAIAMVLGLIDLFI